ncbi:transcriptional regulator [Yamadazyma tenuis]|uniref:NOT2/NOT3/NOT5 C-terminal domain-containing protein n=1 Tax=Candida tenuis (strain ATCC 10573 / BCRC 21748 / CBS 615 / JCM 9827 / NBRC 10315 / NRRL Y-1498 / VKM Y-70) TaxID=590646 RepID=G3BBA8_CANTC|nr:uncharacterized protein CANTEDRAFT_115002 [Yamadazyma tenuis ATCC 10573]EGV61533.1 hypothetical protein CANTEDRAFT_115002 [Yamadazyma tenuis ATCC 10573]WEJ92755.1 transcriptional regulator [Yamadazyma tenuis]
MLPPGLTANTPPSSSAISNGNGNGSVVLDNDMAKYGLQGVASLVKMDNPEKTTFSIGQDLNLLGLDLGSNSQILKNLASPWSETSRSEVEPYFTLPESIQPQNIIPAPGPCDSKIQSFSDETLFYIFYMKPRDTLQEYAARELVARNWRYHKEIQVWLTKDSNVEPVLISQDVEKGVYIFFDPHNWEKIKKEFVLHYSSVQA